MNQIASYTVTMEHMKTYVGQKYDPVVLETIKKIKTKKSGLAILLPFLIFLL